MNDIEKFELVLGNTIVPLDSLILDLEKGSSERVIEFAIDQQQIEPLTQAWQKIAHSKRPMSTQRPVTNISPDKSVIYSNGANLASSNVNYSDISYADIDYLSVDRSHLVYKAVQYAHVLYADVSYHDVSYYSELKTEQGTAIENSDDGESVTIVGERANGRRVVITLNGVIGLDVSMGREEPRVVLVQLSLVEDLPIEELVWVIEQ